MVLARNEGRDISHEGPEILADAAQAGARRCKAALDTWGDVTFNYDVDRHRRLRADRDRQRLSEDHDHDDQPRQPHHPRPVLASCPTSPTRRSPRRSSTPATTAGRSASNTPTTRIRATPTGRCTATRCSTCKDAGRHPDGDQRLPQDASRTTTSASSRSTRRAACETSRMSFIVNRPANEPGFRAGAPGERRAARIRYTHRQLRGRRSPKASATDATQPMPVNRRCRRRHAAPADRAASTCAALSRTRSRRRARRSSTASWSAWRRSRRASATSPRCCWSTSCARELRPRSRRRPRCTCASPAIPAPARPPWRCAWRRSCTGSATCAKATWSR